MRETRSGRSQELDGLRGLAALIVVFSHFFDLFPPSRWTLVWKLSPLSLFTAGRGPVVIFFVLSGFALHRMLLGTIPFRYYKFALRRTVRIYGPYLAALTLALAGNYWLSRGVRPNFSVWFNQSWPIPIDRAAVWQHVAFLGEFDTKPFDGSYWSLIHEMRISLVFPLLFLMVKRKSAAWYSCAAFFLLTAGVLLKPYIPKPNSFAESLHFAGLFVAGIYISERERSLANWFQSQSISSNRLFAASALVLFCYGRFASHLFPSGSGEFLDVPVGLGAAALIVMAFSAAPFSVFLVSKPVAWLGAMSYSLYLVHGTALLAMVNLLNLRRPNVFLLPLYLMLALLLARFFYVVVERPLVLLSRRFTPGTGTRVTDDSKPLTPPARDFLHL